MIEQYLLSTDLEMNNLGIRLLCNSFPKNRWKEEIFRYFSKVSTWWNEDIIVTKNHSLYKLVESEEGIQLYHMSSGFTSTVR
jgi:hypothetical protein